MKFSIIIPAHNSSQYIHKALDGVAMQTFTDYELIVVCDACKDDTQKIADSYGAKIHVVNFGNDGLTRSKGIDEATGDYILFIDDDDWWLDKDMLQLLSDKIEEENEPDVICFSFEFQYVGYCRPHDCNGQRWVATWNKCWKRSAIGNTRFPNVFSISDRYFHEEMMAKNLRIVDWDKCFYYYNFLRPGSITQKRGFTAEFIRKALGR